jgi:hypothetical protein
VWRELMFADTDQEAWKSRDPVSPAQRSADAERKARTGTLADGTPAHSFRTLLEELSMIVRNTCRTPAAGSDAPAFRVTTTANPKQRCALALIRKIRV